MVRAGPLFTKTLGVIADVRIHHITLSRKQLDSIPEPEPPRRADGRRSGSARSSGKDAYAPAF
jgi:hypothetical protein